MALTDVLALASPTRDAAHVGFEGQDVSAEAQPPQRYGGSIPIEKARRPEVLLAWSMNGEPLPPVHGAPLEVMSEFSAIGPLTVTGYAKGYVNNATPRLHFQATT